MNTIERYVREASSLRQDSGDEGAYLSERAERHQQEADRLYRLGDDRQAAMHASISRKHRDAAQNLAASAVSQGSTS
jgi:hypothetical protein